MLALLGTCNFVSVTPNSGNNSKGSTLIERTGCRGIMEVLINACSRSDAVNEFLNALLTPERALLEELIEKYLCSPQGFITFNEVMSTIIRSRSHGPIYLDKFFKNPKRLEEVFEYIQKQRELLMQGHSCEGLMLSIGVSSENFTPLLKKRAPPQLPSTLQAPVSGEVAIATTQSSSANCSDEYRHYQPRLGHNYSGPYPRMGEHWSHRHPRVETELALPGPPRISEANPLLTLTQSSPAYGPLTFGFRALPESFGPTSGTKGELDSRLINVYMYDDFFKADGSFKFPQPPPLDHDQDYKCHECDKNYLNKRSLYNHLRIHKALSREETVQTSLSSKNADKKLNGRHTCDICGKEFSGERELMLHASIHSNFRAYGCGHCGKSYSSKGRLRTHMRSHSTHRAFKCPTCERTFIYKGHLNRHRRNSCKLAGDTPPAESKETEEAEPQQQEESLDLLDPESPPQLIIKEENINPISTVSESGDDNTPASAELPDCLSEAPLPPTPLFYFSEVYSNLGATGEEQA